MNSAKTQKSIAATRWFSGGSEGLENFLEMKRPGTFREPGLLIFLPVSIEHCDFAENPVAVLFMSQRGFPKLVSL